jgi:tripartite-type tricarboxylate transporter receptor subunit TctC
MMTKIRTIIGVGLSLGLSATAAMAQSFPSKPITIIVAYGAGGGTDAFVRAAAEPMGKKLGQTVLVTNKPGAGGGVAATAVKNAAPDGYTLVATGSLTYSFEPQMLKTQYNVKDFEHVAIVSQFQDGLFTNPKRPYKTMRDVINAAKKEKRAIKYASLYQLDRMIFQSVAKQEGVQIIPVPTKGGNGAVQAVLANQVDFGFSGGTFGPHVESGKLRLIGALAYERLERFPNTPSMKDNGWKLGTENFLILSAPKGTPKPVVAKLAAALKEAYVAPTVRSIVKARYMKEVFYGPGDVDKQLDRQIKTYGAAIKEHKASQKK